MKHFGKVDGEYDIYVDCDEGILRLCVVGMLEEKYEAEISGLNECDNESGWVPHIVFLANNNHTFRIARIPNDWYGKPADIPWI